MSVRPSGLLCDFRPSAGRHARLPSAEQQNEELEEISVLRGQVRRPWHPELQTWATRCAKAKAGQHAASERRIVKDLLHATEDFCP
jgi:hypothetical protein